MRLWENYFTAVSQSVMSVYGDGDGDEDGDGEGREGERGGAKQHPSNQHHYYIYIRFVYWVKHGMDDVR